MIIVITVAIYFVLLFTLSRLTGKGARNEEFYRAGRRSRWYMVAFGMVGASISGVTFISVPGMVTKIDMTYLQTCLGFILGYFAVAFILLPLYYRLNLTSIYTYLGKRLGQRSHLTGSWFFLITKMAMATVRFYVVCIILQHYVFDDLGIPFLATAACMVALIWLYTHQGGIKTLVWTDTFQTICLFTALILIIINVIHTLDMSVGEAATAITESPMSRIFVFDDWISTQNFWKQFLSGAFIVVVMTGLDQDMMQKNLTCKTVREAQKDMCTYGFAFVPANLLFLALGILLIMLAQREGITLPSSSDDILPMFAASGMLGVPVIVLFTIGIVASSFSSADSALTSLTTIYCVDIRKQRDDETLRHRAHLVMCLLFFVFILLFKAVNSTNVIDAIYTIVSYSYGPLLGLFAFGMTTKRGVNDGAVPYIAVASPIICFVIDKSMQALVGYHFGYELLILNGALTYLGLYIFYRPIGKKG